MGKKKDMAFIILQLGLSQVLSFSCGRERESLERGKICVLCFCLRFDCFVSCLLSSWKQIEVCDYDFFFSGFERGHENGLLWSQ